MFAGIMSLGIVDLPNNVGKDRICDHSWLTMLLENAPLNGSTKLGFFIYFFVICILRQHPCIDIFPDTVLAALLVVIGEMLSFCQVLSSKSTVLLYFSLQKCNLIP